MLTQCPSCQTTFRITSEILRVAHGQVRCGRCHTQFDALERLVDAARQIDSRTYVAVLLGADAGLRAGEMMALAWTDVDVVKKYQVCVERSDWKGHVTSPKGGRLRYVPLTRGAWERPSGRIAISAAHECCAKRTGNR